MASRSRRSRSLEVVLRGRSRKLALQDGSAGADGYFHRRVEPRAAPTLRLLASQAALQQRAMRQGWSELSLRGDFVSSN